MAAPSADGGARQIESGSHIPSMPAALAKRAMGWATGLERPTRLRPAPSCSEQAGQEAATAWAWDSGMNLALDEAMRLLISGWVKAVGSGPAAAGAGLLHLP